MCHICYRRELYHNAHKGIVSILKNGTRYLGRIHSEQSEIIITSHKTVRIFVRLF